MNRVGGCGFCGVDCEREMEFNIRTTRANCAISSVMIMNGHEM